MFDVATLQNLGIIDANFPYPLAFCSAFNIAIILVNAVVFLALTYIILKIVKWFFKLF